MAVRVPSKYDATQDTEVDTKLTNNGDSGAVVVGSTDNAATLQAFTNFDSKVATAGTGSFRVDTAVGDAVVVSQTGLVTVGAVNYETLVVGDDDVPNKKYVDDAVSGATGEGAYACIKTVGATAAMGAVAVNIPTPLVGGTQTEIVPSQAFTPAANSLTYTGTTGKAVKLEAVIHLYSDEQDLKLSARFAVNGSQLTNGGKCVSYSSNSTSHSEKTAHMSCITTLTNTDVVTVEVSYDETKTTLTTITAEEIVMTANLL